MSDKTDAGLICEMCRDEDVEQVEMLVYSDPIERRIFACTPCGLIVENMCKGESGGRKFGFMLGEAVKKGHSARAATLQRLLMHRNRIRCPRPEEQ